MVHFFSTSHMSIIIISLTFPSEGEMLLKAAFAKGTLCLAKAFMSVRYHEDWGLSIQLWMGTTTFSMRNNINGGQCGASIVVTIDKLNESMTMGKALSIYICRVYFNRKRSLTQCCVLFFHLRCYVLLHFCSTGCVILVYHKELINGCLLGFHTQHFWG